MSPLPLQSGKIARPIENQERPWVSAGHEMQLSAIPHIHSPNGSATARVAAIDCGTNALRLLIYECGEGSHSCSQSRELVRETRSVALGADVARTGFLSPDTVSTCLDILRYFAGLCRAHGVSRTHMCATSAARRAANAADLLIPAAQVIGSTPEIISGEEEGKLTFLGATAAVSSVLAGVVTGAPLAVVDIGGGSSELALGTISPPFKDDVSSASSLSSSSPTISGPHTIVSVDIGSSSLSHSYSLHLSPTSPSSIEAARCAAREDYRCKLSPALSTDWFKHIDHVGGSMRSGVATCGVERVVVGTGGILTTLATLAQGVPYTREKVQGFVLDVEMAKGILDRCAGMTREENARLPGMWEGHVDVIIGGICAVLSLMEVLQCTKCIVSESDLLDGMSIKLCSCMEIV
ncbi:unnamed protein product [Closterium sp. NIES-53]